MIPHALMPDSIHIYGFIDGFPSTDQFYQVEEFVDSEDEDDYIVLKSTLTEDQHTAMPDSRLIEVLVRYPELWSVPWLDEKSGEEYEKLVVARRMIEYLAHVHQPLSTVNGGQRIKENRL